MCATNDQLKCEKCHRYLGFVHEHPNIFSLMYVRALLYSPVEVNTMDGREVTYIRAIECGANHGFDLCSDPMLSLERFRATRRMHLNWCRNFLSLFRSPFVVDQNGSESNVEVDRNSPSEFFRNGRYIGNHTPGVSPSEYMRSPPISPSVFSPTSPNYPIFSPVNSPYQSSIYTPTCSPSSDGNESDEIIDLSEL